MIVKLLDMDIIPGKYDTKETVALCEITTGYWFWKETKEQWFRKSGDRWYSFPEFDRAPEDVHKALCGGGPDEWLPEYVTLIKKRENQPLTDLADTEL